MLNNIEQAFADLMGSNTPLTLPNVFQSYMRVAGFTEICNEAIVSFQHAMDKQPIDPHGHSAKMKELRIDYWVDKLGMRNAKDLVPGRCRDCGQPTTWTLSEYLAGEEDASEQSPPKFRKKRTGKSKKLRRSATSSKRYDPYGPSTSASACQV